MRLLLVKLLFPFVLAMPPAHGSAQHAARSEKAVHTPRPGHVRWRYAPRADAFTLGLRYDTALARKVNAEMAVKFPDVDVRVDASQERTEPSECDTASVGCTSLRQMVLAAENIARTVGSIHWVRRFGNVEFVAGVILPDAELIPPSDLDTQRLTLHFLPPIDRDPGMLNARVTVF
jgi:hypothetical protein